MKTNEEQLKELVGKMAKLHEVEIQPRFPLVFVRVLPKESEYRGIILPEKHSKPMYEAIVIRTWNPFWKQIESTREGGATVRHRKLVESELQPGDHVILPHFAGMPVPGYDRDHYRMVPEVHDEGRWGYGACVLGILTNVRATELAPLEKELGKKAAVAALDKYYLIPKKVKPVSMSGA